MLSPRRDLASAQAFFEQATTVVEPPQKLVTDGLASYPRAVRETLGEVVSLSETRKLFRERVYELRSLLQAA